MFFSYLYSESSEHLRKHWVELKHCPRVDMQNQEEVTVGLDFSALPMIVD